jgi:hypothetical protein
LLVKQKLLEIQYVSDRAKQALLDAITELNLIQGQARTENMTFPRFFTMITKNLQLRHQN